MLLLLFGSLGDGDAVAFALGLLVVIVVVVVAGKGNCVLGAGMFSTHCIVNKGSLLSCNNIT